MDGEGDDWSDDGKGTVSPRPPRRLEEGLRGTWTDEGRDDVGGCGESEDESPVLERRGVGHEDVEDVGHPVETDPVEDLGSW